MTHSLPRLTLVLGGARSGKSRFAEEMLAGSPPPWTYIATAEALDGEMQVRIAEHVARRGAGWTTIEAPHDLGSAIRKADEIGAPVLIDCLTLWLSNVLLAGRELPAEMGRICTSLRDARGPLVVISNEVGLSIVPDNRLARAFRDAQGLINQRVAQISEHVVFVAAGLPLTLK